MPPRNSLSIEVEALRRHVCEAVNDMLNESPNLVACDAHEQGISHRIAVYLERRVGLPDIHVDCEYNLDMSNPKKWEITRAALECRCRSCANRETEVRIGDLRRFRPDILVHKRKDQDSNLIALEIKRDYPCEFDVEKLKALTDPHKDFKYRLGVFLCFPQGAPRYKFYVDGVENQGLNVFE
jgi:hypothetical protein